MFPNIDRMSSRTLAEFFLMHADRRTIISELACLYYFDDTIEDDVISENLNNMILEFEASGFSDADILTEIIELLRRRMISRQKRENLLLNQTFRYIEEHLTDNMKIEELADSLHVNFNYLCRFFKWQTGMTPNNYKNRKRIEKSIPMLTRTDQPITDIARLCGFDNSSYFTKQFTNLTGMSPSAFRSAYSSSHFGPHYDLSDILLATKLDSIQFLGEAITELPRSCVETHVVSELNAETSNLAIPAVMVHQNTLYALWCLHFPQIPQGISTIHGKLSRDGGKHWMPIQVLTEAASSRVHIGPTFFGQYSHTLYLFQNQWVGIPSAQCLEIQKLDPTTDRFVPLYTLPFPFIPSANLMRLPNGSLILPGRTWIRTPYDNVPAVLISESGTLGGEWNMIPVMEDNCLPDGSRLICPHTSLLYCNDTLYLFCRNDRRLVPLVFLSHDFGRTWSSVKRYDFPYAEGGKLYSGTLSTGENYLILPAGNSGKQYDHSMLCIYFSRKRSMIFDRKLVLFDRELTSSPPFDYSNQPCAVEHDGKLHIITAIHHEKNESFGTLLYTIDLSILQ